MKTATKLAMATNILKFYTHFIRCYTLILVNVQDILYLLTVTCPAGQEDVNDSCEPCMVGYYKESEGIGRCMACPSSPTKLTTSGTGSTFEANCSIGLYYTLIELD